MNTLNDRVKQYLAMNMTSGFVYGCILAPDEHTAHHWARALFQIEYSRFDWVIEYDEEQYLLSVAGLDGQYL